MTTSVTAATTRNPAVGSGSDVAIWVESNTERASAKAPLTGAGMILELNGGAGGAKPGGRARPGRGAAGGAARGERALAAAGPGVERRRPGEQGGGGGCPVG